MKILVLSPYLPHRRVGHGGGAAVRDLVRWLARSHRVLLVALVRPGEAALVDEVRELGAAVAALPFVDRGARGADRARLWSARAAAAARCLGSRYPWYVEKYRSPGLSRRVADLIAAFTPDAVQVEYLQLALLLRDARRAASPGAPRPCFVLNSHELGSVPRERHAALASNPLTRAAHRLEAAAWRRLQVDATTWADRTLCVTPEDHALYAAMGGRRLETVPLGMDTEAIAADWSPDPRRETYLFVGAYAHRPNRLAADALLADIWPRIRAARPAAELLLVGRGSRRHLAAAGPADRWRALGVNALGYVDDLAPLFRACRAFLAPLPEGGGIKIKVLEALARGVPVVTTPVGAEGIVPPGGDVALVAADHDAFVAGVLALAAAPAEAAAMAARGRRHLAAHFDWSAITARLTAIYGACRAELADGNQ